MTTFLLILLLVAILIAYKQRNKSPELAKPVLAVLVALIFIVSGARLFCSGRRAASMSEEWAATEAFLQAAAYRLGQAVAEDVPSGSSILVITDGSRHVFLRRNREAMLSGLERGLGREYTVHRHEALPPGMAGPDGGMEDAFMDEALLLPDEFTRALSRHPDAQAVVSLIGPPLFTSPPRPDTVPPLYIMSVRGDSAPTLLQHGLVKAQVVYRASGVDRSLQPRRGMSMEEIFDLRFQLERSAR